MDADTFFPLPERKANRDCPLRAYIHRARDQPRNAARAALEQRLVMTHLADVMPAIARET